MIMNRGFTLLEMMVSIGIFAIITAVVIFNHGKFNSSINVTNLSYELALAIREAQVYGLAVKQEAGNDISEDYAYGVYFNINNPQTFYIFADKDSNQQFDPTGGDLCDGTEECQERIEIRGDVEISNLASNQTDPAEQLTILFLRPNPVAIIHDDGTEQRSTATIELHSDRAEKSKLIMVELSGQISVQDKQ